MDQHTPTGGTVPMHKQETVKDDGRTLIYYTFPPEGEVDKAESAPQGAGESQGAGAEVPHV